VLSDCFTLREHRGSLAGLRVAFVGDGNNMVHSWMDAAARLGFDFALACPPGYEPDPAITAEAGARVTVTHDVAEAARGADVVYTDVWTSMGQEAEAKARRRAFQPYQVNEKVVALARPDALVMHCLPAHRGEEITDAVLEGPQSVVFDQAENRLHVQKAVMVWLLYSS
jgi:ornithine carbamoyltransferase